MADAETGTSGEIVTVIADATDDYPEALWRGGAVGVLLALTFSILAAWLRREWVFDPLVQVALPMAGGAAVGAGLAWFNAPLRRVLAGADVMSTRVCDAAEAAFLEEGVFETRDRSGVLIFVTLFERQAVVLADEGVHAAVPTEVWVDVVEAVGTAMRRGQPVAGLIDAIVSCGRILLDHDLKARADDTDELDDQPRVRPQ